MRSIFNKILVASLLILMLAPVIANASYVSTGRDTQENPDELTEIPILSFDASGYAKIKENANFNFYWREDRDIFAIHDKRNGFVWKTGLDVDPAITRQTQLSICRTAKSQYNTNVITYEEFQDRCEVGVDTMSSTESGPLFANSLLYFEYYSKGASDSVFSTDTVYSSSTRITLNITYSMTSTLQMVNADDTHWRFTMTAGRLGVEKNLDLTVVADIYLTEAGLKIEILQDQLAGSALEYLSTIGIARFLGAVGGVETVFTTVPMTDPLTGNFIESQVQKPLIGGYAFVPDGSGSLIRFKDNSVVLSKYESYVYGSDPSQNEQNYQVTEGTYVPFKTASMPVFGIAQGNNQAAFVAYADSGSEFMYISSSPEENGSKYNTTHAKFSYNFKYNKLYTLDGADPVPTIYEEQNQFDIVMYYDFLSGDGTTDDYPANYVGMALKYKNHLLATGRLNEMTMVGDDIGIRIDFLMGDVEDSIVGYKLQVATTANDVRTILNELVTIGITNISSGLLGWADGGVTLGRPDKTEFTSKIGTKATFRKLIDEFGASGIDISFYQDYFMINEDQIGLYRNATKHPAGWYARLLSYQSPIWTFYYARPLKSVEWLENQANTFLDMGVRSLTIAGMTDNLITDYTNGIFTRTEGIQAFQTALAALGEEALINAVRPNSFLFPYVDRYLNMNVYGTQYLIETDTVPFTQLVLQGSMELYAIYSNFSFYTTNDILRMIDYNVYPSFVLTNEPSYVITHTNSSEYYSTEYTLYREMIQSTYNQINAALAPVMDAHWTNREVLTLGVICNTYDDGTKIYVNYTDVAYVTGSISIPAASSLTVGGE